MKKILALDLGVGSIGVALELSNESENSCNQSLKPTNLKTFVRIFQPSSDNLTRRTKRITRRTLDRKQKRKLHLWQSLAEIGFSKEFNHEVIYEITASGKKKLNLNGTELDGQKLRFSNHTLKKDVYKLRNDALDKQLNCYEIGFILYHLANHRGSSAISALDADEKTSGKNKKKLGKTVNLVQTENHIDNKYRTYGEMLYQENLLNKTMNNKKAVRNKLNKNFQYFADRYLIISEAKQILQKQQEYYPELLTKNKIEEIITILDWESEKDVPQAKLCVYTGELPLPLASELYEERRILENLNNVRITKDIRANKYLSFDERDILFEELINGVDLSETEIKKLLSLNKTAKVALPGRTLATKKLLGSCIKQLNYLPFYKDLSKTKQDEFVKKYITAPDDRTFKSYLEKTYKLPYDKIVEIMSSKYLSEKVLRKGYSDISASFTQAIIKNLKLETHITYNEALAQIILDEEDTPENKRLIKTKKENKVYSQLPYYGEVLFEYTQPVVARSYLSKFAGKNTAGKEISPIKQRFNLDELKYGQIPNPVIHKTLNQLRKVINEIIVKYGSIDEIIIEYARGLSLSEEERGKLSLQQNKNEKDIEKIKLEFAKNGEHNPTPTQIKAWRLATYQNFICPYTGKNISISDVINNKVDIDHIIPENISHDSRNLNLLTTFRANNADKTDKTPYQAFYGTENWDYLQNYLSQREKYSKYNGWRFTEDALEEFKRRNPFLQRYKTDNSYIAKATKKYLTCLFADKKQVYTFKSDFLAQLRKAWGFNNITTKFVKNYLTNAENTELNQENNAVSFSKKNRLDHRHHAFDALMLLLVNRGQQQKMSTLTAKYGQDYLKDFDTYLAKYNKLSSEEKTQDTATKAKIDELFKFKQKIINDKPLSRNELETVLLNTKISQAYSHKKAGQIDKKTLYQIVNDSNPKNDNNLITITTKKNLELKDLKLTETDFQDNLKVKTAIVKQISINHTIHVSEEVKEIFETKINAMVGLPGNNYEELDGYYNQAKEKLEQDNLDKSAEGRKTFAITQKKIWANAITLLFNKNPKGYKKFENKLRDKVLILKEPNLQENKPLGFGYVKRNNHCIELYYNNQGELQGEIIRTLDVLKKDFKPQYQKDGFIRCEKLFQGDILEFDLEEHHKYFSNPYTGAPQGKVWLKIRTYTEAGKSIDIQFKFNNKSGSNTDTKLNINSLAKRTFRRVLLSPLGEVKYRSALLKPLIKP